MHEGWTFVSDGHTDRRRATECAPAPAQPGDRPGTTAAPVDFRATATLPRRGLAAIDPCLPRRLHGGGGRRRRNREPRGRGHRGRARCSATPRGGPTNSRSAGDAGAAENTRAVIAGALAAAARPLAPTAVLVSSASVDTEAHAAVLAGGVRQVVPELGHHLGGRRHHRLLGGHRQARAGGRRDRRDRQRRAGRRARPGQQALRRLGLRAGRRGLGLRPGPGGAARGAAGARGPLRRVVPRRCRPGPARHRARPTSCST